MGLKTGGSRWQVDIHRNSFEIWGDEDGRSSAYLSRNNNPSAALAGKIAQRETLVRHRCPRVVCRSRVHAYLYRSKYLQVDNLDPYLHGSAAGSGLISMGAIPIRRNALGGEESLPTLSTT